MSETSRGSVASPEPTVKLPTNRVEAELMAKLGLMWLAQNGAESVASKPAPGGESKPAPDLREALAELVEAVTAEVNEKGAGGYLLARLSDARAALASQRDSRPPVVGSSEPAVAEAVQRPAGEGQRVYVTTNDSGDWCEVRLEDRFIHGGHDIPSHIWREVIEALGHRIDFEVISDEEMEARS